MKFSVSSTTISQVLSLVSPAVSNRPTKPILANIKIVADAASGTVQLTAMNDSMAITGRFDALILEDGSVCAPKGKLVDLLGTFSGEILEFEFEDSILKVINGKSSYKINALPAHDFPGYPKEADTEPFTFPAMDLYDGLRTASTTASNDETKQVLCGVHVAINNGKIEFASTDSHRLTVVHYSVDTEDNRAFTMPIGAINAINRLLQNQGLSGDITLHLGNSVAHADIGTTSISLRLLEGQYPYYRNLLPAQSAMQFKAVLPAASMLKALDRLKGLGSDKTPLVILDFVGDELNISTKDAEVSEGSEYIELTESPSSDFRIAFNALYLRQAIKNSGTDNVRFFANTPTSPVTLYPEDSDGIEALIMPVQLRNA